jgi:hypothetical protein
MARAGLGSGWECLFANDFDHKKGRVYRDNWGDGELVTCDVHFLQAFQECFQGKPEEVHFVDFEVGYSGTDTVRKTRVQRNGEIVMESGPTAIRRT